MGRSSPAPKGGARRCQAHEGQPHGNLLLAGQLGQQGLSLLTLTEGLLLLQQ